jgi:hypothetical protein
MDLTGPTPREDLFLQKLDVPSPAIREVVDDQVGDGVVDRSLYVGPRTAAVELRLGDTPEQIMGQLRPYMSPRVRPLLRVVDSEWAQDRQLVMRGVSWAGERSGVLDRLRDVQLQWTVPSGTWEAVLLTSVSIAAATGGGDGRVYDLVTPRTYPATVSARAGRAQQPWDLHGAFKARLYGPCIGPRLTETDGLAVRSLPSWCWRPASTWRSIRRTDRLHQLRHRLDRRCRCSTSTQPRGGTSSGPVTGPIQPAVGRVPARSP